MSQLSYQFSIVTVIFIARFLYPKMICIVDCWYNAWPIRDFAVYESDDEYNNMASDVVPAADRDPPEDRDPREASGPSEDRDLPEARGGPTEDRDSTNDGASTSQV